MRFPKLKSLAELTPTIERDEVEKLLDQYASKYKEFVATDMLATSIRTQMFQTSVRTSDAIHSLQDQHTKLVEDGIAEVNFSRALLDSITKDTIESQKIVEHIYNATQYLKSYMSNGQLKLFSQYQIELSYINNILGQLLSRTDEADAKSKILLVRNALKRYLTTSVQLKHQAKYSGSHKTHVIKIVESAGNELTRSTLSLKDFYQQKIRDLQSKLTRQQQSVSNRLTFGTTLLKLHSFISSAQQVDRDYFISTSAEKQKYLAEEVLAILSEALNTIRVLEQHTSDDQRPLAEIASNTDQYLSLFGELVHKKTTLNSQRILLNSSYQAMVTYIKPTYDRQLNIVEHSDGFR